MIWLTIIVIVSIFWIVITDNGLVKLRVRVDSAWADIDVPPKRRHDFIPNVVETVKGYAAFERSTLEKVTEARARAAGFSLTAEAERASLARLATRSRTSTARPGPVASRSCPLHRHAPSTRSI